MWSDAFSEAFLRKLDGLALRAEAAGRAYTAGARRAKARGGSVEFADFREYVPGDDTRRIDWSAFARFDRLYVRLFLDERDTLLTVWLDSSASMAAKAGCARQLAATLVYLALCRFDRAVVCAADTKVRVRSEVFSGRQAFHRAVRFLDGLEFAGDTRLVDAVRAAPPPAGGISAVISDLLTEGDWKQVVPFLKYCKQDVAVLQVFSPGELRPAFDGPVRLVSEENEPAVDLTASPAVLEAYRRVMDAFVGDVRVHCHASGAAHMLADAGEPLERLVFDGMAGAGVVR